MKHKILVLLLMPLLALRLSAQTHFPVYSPAYANPQQVDTDSFETLVAQWNIALNQVQRQVNSSNQNFQVFTNYYQNYIDSLRIAFIQVAQTGSLNLSNVAAYLNPQKQVLQALYNSFVNIQNNYPDSNLKRPLTPNLAPLNNPPTCNVACTNMDFSDNDFTGWYGYYATNSSTTSYNITGVTGGYLGAVQRGAMSSPGDYQIHLTSAANNDWFLKNFHGINMSQSSPWGSGHSAMIGDSVNKGGIVAILSQKFNVTNLTNSITYAYSVFLENPGHTYYEQPFFSVTLFDQNGDTIKDCGEYDVVSGPGLKGFTGEYYSPRTDTIYWRNWTLVNVPLNNYVGQCVTIQFEVSDCEPSGHCGYAYVDASCGQFAITASAPAICGKNGTLTLTGPAGESSYSWSGPSNSIVTNDTLQSVTVDSAGKYMLVITPVTGNLCKDTLYYTVIKDTISAKAVPTDIKCNGGLGSELATESNGTGPFAYAWTPVGGTNSNATGLSVGTYTVTITDGYGCSATSDASITQPILLTAAITGSTNLLCNGNNIGSATVAAGGGTPGYLYLWSPGGNTNANATGLSAGSYTVTVTDNNGCTATASVTITQPLLALSASMGAVSNVSCNGDNDGSANANVNGGTSPYTYAWTPVGGTNANATGLSAGSYTLTVTDNHGCTATTSVTITQPTPLVVNIVANSHKVCHGTNNGNAQANPSGGTPGYNYLWTNGSTKAQTGPVSAGTYTVTVTDANGCTATASISLTQPPALTVTTGAPTNLICNGNNIGSDTAYAAGGTPAYTYSWAPGGYTNAIVTGLGAGNYTVTVTDSCGETATALVTITQPALLTANIGAISNVSCNGGNNASATVAAGGGVSPYTYAWTPIGGTNANATGLNAGSYTVTVTDNHGCTATASVTITQPVSALSAAIGAVSNVSCNGGSNASANANVNGGTSPYTYAWTPVGGTNANATGLSAGSYTVTVTDNHGCTATASVTITQPVSALSATIGAVTNVSCNGGNNASANANVNGGTSPYTYAWTPVGGTNANATGLTAGSYTVTVTDNHGCTATASVTITQPVSALSATIGAVTNVSCNGENNASANVNVNGGTSPYTYAWTPVGGTNANATGLTAGSYTVTVTDNNGCTATASVTITQPVSALSATIGAVTNVSCNGGNNASANANVIGGTSPYTYAWTPVGGTNANATGLTAGSYTVTVTDNNGCTTTASVTITQPVSALSASIGAVTNVSCNGGNNASANANVNGGTSPYTYAWTPVGGTNANATGLTAGSYTVTVTDNHGCTATADVTITQPVSALSASIGAVTNVSCNGGNNASANANVIGGTSPYTYVWTPVGGTNANATGLTAGSYTVMVTDNHGCTATASVTITQPLSVLNVSIGAVTNVLCNGGNNASANANVIGGTSPYTYVWTPVGGTNANATGLTAGSYTVMVTDNHGCTATASVTITQPVSALSATIGAVTNVSCNGGNNASANANVIGGTSPYTYAWTPVGGTNANATGLTAGSYTVTVTDNNGCTTTASVTITQPVSALSTTIGAVTNVSCNGGSNASANANVNGGTSPYTYAWTPVGGTNANATGLTAGSYTVTVTDNHGCTATADVTITQPTPLTASTSFTQASCGKNNGTATVVAGGGTPGYVYLWSPGGNTNAIATGLFAASYTVTVTDNNGCTITAAVTVTEPTSLVASVSGNTPVSCNGGNNGTATATANGGNSPYTYSWSPVGGNNAIGTGLSAGTYTVTVKDSNGCTASASVNITQPTLVVANINVINNALCNGEAGTATVTAGGGTPGYAYNWTPSGGTNATGTGLTAGSYTVTVTDNNGCTATTSATITQPTVLTATMGALNNVLCNGGTGTAIVIPGGGTSPYAYNWSPTGGNNATGTGLTAGNYTVTITDNNGCTATATTTITQPTVLTATMGAITNVLCNGGTGTATVTAGGGTSPYAYLWTPTGGNGAVGTGLSAGTYTVTVKDADGCTQTASATITQPVGLTATLTPKNVSCFESNNGTISVNPAGGTAPYVYTWSDGQTTVTATGLAIGTYTVTVKDANGCSTSASTSLTQPNVLTVSEGGPTLDCSGASITLVSRVSGGTAPYAYNWSPSGGTNATDIVAPMANTTYTLTVTDANGCSASADNLTVTMRAPLSVTVSGDTSVCPETQVILTATGSGGDGTYNYLWTPGNQTTQIITFTPTKDTVVTVELTDDCGSSMVSLRVPVSVQTFPDLGMTGDILKGCVPLCIQFRSHGPATGISQWNWNFGNGDSAMEENPIFCYKDTGAFSVSLTEVSKLGCSKTLKVINMIHVYPVPKANFIYSPQPISSLDPEVQFTDQSSGKYPIIERYWNFGEGDSTSYLTNPTHYYPDTGVFCPTLIVMDVHGCTDSITNCLDVAPLFTFYIPDAFTPNGDGINDVFSPKGTNIKDYDMMIYDRWGMKLYETTDLNKGWDGTTRGSSALVQEDVYIYSIHVTDAQGIEHTYTGRVTLLK